MTVFERFKLITPLLISSAAFIVIGIYMNDDGLFISLGTGIIGIIITIIYVDIIIAKHEKRKWKAVSELLQKEIYITSNVLVSSFRTAFKLSPDDFFGFDSMYKMIDMDERAIAVNVLEAYKRKISDNIYGYIVEMDESSWKLLLTNLGNLHNACINFQSMYNSISSPKQIECIMTVTTETFIILQHLKLVPEYYSMSHDEFRYNHDDDKVNFKLHYQKKLGVLVNQLVERLYEEVTSNSN